MLGKIIRDKERELMWVLVYYAEELLQEKSIESDRMEIYNGEEVYTVLIRITSNHIIKIERPQWTFNLWSLDLPIVGLKIKERKLKKIVEETIRTV